MDPIKNKKNNLKKAHLIGAKRGSILAYSLIIITMMIAIATSLSISTVLEKKGASATDFSAQAYQTADSGVQLAIKKINNNLNSKINDPGMFVCDASGNVTAIDAGPAGSSYKLSFYTDSAQITDCNELANTIRIIKSTGTYQGTVRTINVSVLGVSSWMSGVCAPGILVYKEDMVGDTRWKDSQTVCVSPQCSSGDLVADNLVDFSTDPENYPARNVCKSIGGRLPTMAELDCIYANKATYGTFQSQTYWSSGESSATDANARSFVDGTASTAAKDSDTPFVRCVR